MKAGPVSLPPHMVRMVRQNGMDKDCGVAAVGMLLGLREPQALAACVAVAPKLLDEGMYWSEIRQVATSAGVNVTLKRKGRYDIDHDTGVLGIHLKKRLGHFVFLWSGRIIEGNTELWLDPEDYFNHYACTPGSLLVRVGD